MNVQLYFHKSQMERIKRECKSVCFIAHEQEGEKYFIKVKVKNELGGKDTVSFPLKALPSQITTKEYDFILNTLKEKGYAGN